MAFFMDGFDYYSATADNGWVVAATAQSTIGAGAYSYGRSAILTAFTGNMQRLFSTVVAGTGTGANWPTVYGGMHLKIGSYTNCRILFYDAATVQCSISFDGSGNIVFSRGDRAATLGTSAVGWSTGFVWFTFKLVLSNTVGTFQCYKNGILALNLTGLDNCSTANEYSTEFKFVSGSGALDVDNFHVFNGQDASPYNAILTERRIKFGLPSGNGTPQDWTASAGSAYQCIDENPPNGDTDYISASTVNNKSTFTYPAFTGVTAVEAVNVILTAKKDDASSRSVKTAIRNSGGTLAYGSDQSLSTSYLGYPSTFLTDPLAGGAWSLSNLNGYQYGVQVAV